MKRALWTVMVMMGILLVACGKAKEGQPKQPSIGPAGPGPAQAPQESTADAPDKTGLDSADVDSLQNAAGPAVDVNRERDDYASLQELAADKYPGCEAPRICGGIAYFDCNEKQGGGGYYYDSATVKLISRCGNHCSQPDPVQAKVCDSLCPPRAYADCARKKK